jgi:hypothetical protein
MISEFPISWLPGFRISSSLPHEIEFGSQEARKPGIRKAGMKEKTGAIRPQWPRRGAITNSNFLVS